MSQDTVRSNPRSREPVEIPPVASWFQDGFHRFLRTMLKRQFHVVAIERDCRQHLDIEPSQPLIVYANHPSWWDPLIAHFLNRHLFSPRQFYAPIDAEALEQYRVFAKLGFFGVRLQSTSGAAAFLKQSTAILTQSRSTTPAREAFSEEPTTELACNALWLTPEGRFTDVRDHSGDLMPGLAHLCHRLENVTAIPLAIEYAFWNERLPVCLVRFGQPLSARDHNQWSKLDWSRELTRHLRESQTRLSERSMARCSDPFDNLLTGKTGGGAIYDFARRVKSLATGKRFRKAHGDQFGTDGGSE